MKSRLVVKPNLCTGCRSCELACAFAHSVKGKMGVSRIYPLPAGGPDLFTPVVCLQCDDPACVKSCLVDALTRDDGLGIIRLDQEKCVKCMACVAACPFGCSVHDSLHDQVVKCDLCDGDPVCAHFCPTKALDFRPAVPKKRKQAS